MLPSGPASEHLALTPSSMSDGSCSGSDPCVGLYIRTAKLVRSIPVVTSILRSLAKSLSLSSSASTHDQDSSDDYPEIGTSAYGEPAERGRLILMVAPNGDQSHNSSSRYPTIRRSKASDARMSSSGLVRNLNPNFNVIQVQAIMKTIQCMVPDDSPLTVLAQQGTETANLVVIEKSTSVPQREPSVGGNDRARRARSEVVSSASPNHRLFEHDARRHITQNRAAWECDRDQDDLRNVIEDHRRSRTRTPSPP
jgi:hypothetical protein